VFSPQRLIGPPPDATGALTHAEFLERARQDRDRDDSVSSRVALGAYLVARLVVRWLSLGDSPQDHEAFEWQRASTRRYVWELDQERAETRFLLSVLDALDGEPNHRVASCRMALTAYAYFLEHEGRLGESLEIVSLAARTYGDSIPAPDFTSLALFMGRLNRLQARWEPANTAYAAAEEAALTFGDRVSALRSLLGRASVLRGQGNLPRACAAVERVIGEATSEDCTEVRSGAYADLAVIFELQGLRPEALQANYEAVRISRDPMNRMRLLGDLGVKLSALCQFDEARMAFEIVAVSEASFLVRTNAVLELMQIESVMRNRMAFERRRHALHADLSRMPPSMSVDYHYKVGLGLARFGIIGRAREAWEQGLKLAELHRLNEWYFRLERELANLGESGAAATAAEAPEPADPPAWMAGVSAGLREFAEESAR
jgi:tetratricopeptide (TPR) repeat protein